MSKTVEVFKVVEVDRGNQYWSVIMDNTDFRTCYVPNQETFPKIAGAPLFAFASLKDARDFLKDASLAFITGAQIWRCQAHLSRKRVRAADWWVGSEMLCKFWHTPLKDINPRYFVDFPEGTVLCNSITLLERIC